MDQHKTITLITTLILIYFLNTIFTYRLDSFRNIFFILLHTITQNINFYEEKNDEAVTVTLQSSLEANFLYCFYFVLNYLIQSSRPEVSLKYLHVFRYFKYQKPQNLKKMLRKSPASNALASVFKNLEFSKSYKID